MKYLKNIFAVMLLVLCIVSCIKDDEPAQRDLEVGDSIPDFTVLMNDGTTVTGTSLRKGVSIVMFFHTGCPDCQNTLPSVQQIYDEYSNEVSFALISREQGNDEVKLYWDNKGYTMPYSAQTSRNVYNLFATTRVPRVYICKDGIIKFMYDDDPIPSYSDLKGNLQNL